MRLDVDSAEADLAHAYILMHHLKKAHASEVENTQRITVEVLRLLDDLAESSEPIVDGLRLPTAKGKGSFETEPGEVFR